DAEGSRCFRIAHAPVTCGAAIDVPLLASNWRFEIDDVMSTPGASSDNDGAEFENGATLSRSSVAPTLMADEMHAGSARASAAPSLPAETTTAMPRDRRLSLEA